MPEAAAFEAWDPVRLEQQLTDQLFQTVSANIDAGLAAREPSVIDWCVTAGYARGNVLPLYYLTHNALRYSKGRVPSVSDVRAGAQFAALLLLRVAQDVVTCKTYLARTDRDAMYTAFSTVVKHWLLRWRAGVLPAPAEVADALNAYVTRPSYELPPATWATCFELPVWGWSWYWGTPSAENKLSLEQVRELVPKTRAAVATDFLAALRAAESWPAFLSLDFTKIK